MKKVFATVAALGMVLGVTANALALDQPGRVSESESTTAPRVAAPTAPGVALWSVAGQWALAGAYISRGMGQPGGAAVSGEGGVTFSDSSDAWYIYSFKVLPVLQVNDKVSMRGEIRFIDRCITGTSCTSDAGERDADFKHIYMDWESPWGKARFGRTPAGSWGTKFYDSTAQSDRMFLWLNMLPENWGSLLILQHGLEGDAVNGPNVSDADNDAYYVDLSYKADFGTTVGALWFSRLGYTSDDLSQGLEDNITTTNFWLMGNYNFDALALQYEVNIAFGDGLPEPGFTESSDQKGWGFYIDGAYKVQDWTIGGQFFTLSGDDNLTDNDNDALLSGWGTGNDFNPSQILFGDYMGMLNADKGSVHPAILNNPEVNPGLWALGAYAKFAMSPSLSFSADVIYASAIETASGWDDDYGTEVGIGLGYKIMDNLTYNAHFSYLWTGDYFTEGGSNETENVYLLAHALSMKF